MQIRLKCKLVTIKCHRILILSLYRTSSKSPHMLTWFLYIFCMQQQFNFYQQWQSQSPNICVRGRKGIRTQKYPQNYILMSTPLFRAVMFLWFFFCKNISSAGFWSIPYLYRRFFFFFLAVMGPTASGSSATISFNLFFQPRGSHAISFSLGLCWKWIP